MMAEMNNDIGAKAQDGSWAFAYGNREDQDECGWLSCGHHDEEDAGLYDQVRYWCPYISPFDPCHPIRVKHFVVPPNLFITFQPEGLPQFSLPEALRCGTLWPALFNPYPVKGSV